MLKDHHFVDIDVPGKYKEYFCGTVSTKKNIFVERLTQRNIIFLSIIQNTKLTLEHIDGVSKLFVGFNVI